MINFEIFKKIQNLVLESFFPTECLGCERVGALICNDCQHSCIKEPKLYCPLCNLGSPVGATHPKCQSPWFIDGIFAAGDFGDPILEKAIKTLKYKNGKILVPALSQFLHLKLTSRFSDFFSNKNYLLTYVPLSPRRQNNRGYNQSELLANHLALLLSAPVANLLVKVRETQDQTKLNKEERLKNVEGAFNIINKTMVRDQIIFIVDDVVTTGATLKECAKVLKRNGANEVWGLVIAAEQRPETARRGLWRF